MSTSPFGGPAVPGPFEQAALAGSLAQADHAEASAPTAPTAPAVPFGLPAQYVPGHEGTGAGAPPAPRPPAGTSLPHPGPPPAAPPSPAGGSTDARSGGRTAPRRPSPVVLAALACGTVLAGALGAWVLLSSTGADDPATTSTGGAVATLDPSPGTASGEVPASSAAPTAGGTSDPGAGAAVVDPAAGSRDPFAPLVAQPAGPSGQEAPGSVPTSTGTTASDPVASAGSSGTAGSGTAASAPEPRPTVTVTSSPVPVSPVALTTAQTCSAVSGPMAAVEQLLSASASGGSAPVDTGTALRTSVSAMRSAVSATADAALASRLDVATSSAESLRSQLLAGVAATSDQVTTQSSLDAAVRTSCA